MGSRQIDDKWEVIEDVYHFLDAIDSQGYALLTSKQLNDTQMYCPDMKFEARNLTKFDSFYQQPLLFQKNGISLFPTKNGEYIIGRFSPFQSIEIEPQDIDTVYLPQLVSFESFAPHAMCNEAMKLNYSDANGVLSSYIGEELTATIAGRMRVGNWNFRISTGNNYLTIPLENPQMEIDAGFEGINTVVITEAKNCLTKQFNLRQLYYPFRYWQDIVSKRVRTLFIAFNDADVFLYEYFFPDYEVFDAQLVDAVHFVIDSSRISKEEIVRVFRNAHVVNEPDITFPQADSALRVMDVIEQIARAEDADNESIQIDSTYLSDTYAFEERQGLYYADAACYLGYAHCLSKSRKLYYPTNKGLLYCNRSHRVKLLSFCSSVFSYPVFNETFKQYVMTGYLPDNGYIAQLIEKYRPGQYADVTKHRRATTVRAWLSWIISLYDGD